MAKYDKYTERNLLNKREKIIQKSVRFFLIISFFDILFLIFDPIRSSRITELSKSNLIGVSILIITSIVRIVQAKKQGKDPFMESSREWRIRKDMLSSYDYLGPGPDYSNKIFNIIYFTGILFGVLSILISLIN